MTADRPDPISDAAFQGAHGAYSEAAARVLVGDDARTLPCRTLEEVFDAVAGGRARHGVVPLENSIAGTVPRVYELLLAHDLQVIAEASIEIDHALIGPPGMRLEDVRRVLSHPVALGQCGAFLRQHPRMEPVAVFDTAGAVEIVTRERDGVTAAIAGRHAARVYGAEVLAEHLQDHRDNWTRFVLLAPAAVSATDGDATRLLVAFDLPHEPGALARALDPLAARGINLTKIESRPIPTKPFEYRFIVELAGGSREALLTGLQEMRARTVSLRVLGHYGTIEQTGNQS